MIKEKKRLCWKSKLGHAFDEFIAQWGDAFLVVGLLIEGLVFGVFIRLELLMKGHRISFFNKKFPRIPWVLKAPQVHRWQRGWFGREYFFFHLEFFFELNKFEFVDVVVLVHLDLLFLDLDFSGAGGNLDLFLKDFSLLVMKLF